MVGRGWLIGPRLRTGSRVGSRRRSSSRSWPGGGRPAMGRCGWRRSSSCLPRRSGRCCGGSGTHGCHGPRATRVCATSARGPASCCDVDTKKLGRFWRLGHRILGRGELPESKGAGWQHLHVAIDDHSRLAYAELLPRDDRFACAAFLERATAWYADREIRIERVLTDNAKSYHSQHWRNSCERLGIGRRYTRPYSPWTNGKAEALIKTLLREWA